METKDIQVGDKMTEQELRGEVAILVLLAMRSTSTCMTQEEISEHWRDEIFILIKEAGWKPFGKGGKRWKLKIYRWEIK